MFMNRRLNVAFLVLEIRGVQFWKRVWQCRPGCTTGLRQFLIEKTCVELRTHICSVHILSDEDQLLGPISKSAIPIRVFIRVRISNYDSILSAWLPTTYRLERHYYTTRLCPFVGNTVVGGNQKNPFDLRMPLKFSSELKKFQSFSASNGW